MNFFGDWVEDGPFQFFVDGSYFKNMEDLILYLISVDVRQLSPRGYSYYYNPTRVYLHPVFIDPKQIFNGIENSHSEKVTNTLLVDDETSFIGKALSDAINAFNVSCRNRNIGTFSHKEQLEQEEYDYIQRRLAEHWSLQEKV